MEQWKQIAGFEGLYEVSNLGNVRSLQRKVRTKSSSVRTSPGRMLLQKTTNNGRRQVHLSKENRSKWYSVSRLVAFAFCDGWFEGAVVNHKDENPLNNVAENLEWVTQSYNCKYGHRNDTMIAQRRTPIKQLTLDGREVATYGILNEAARLTGVNASHICDVCKGRRKMAGGFKWEYM